MSFAWPWIFAALPLPWLLRRLLAPAEAIALRVPRLPDVAPLAHGMRARLLPLAAASLAWLLLLTAAARPQLPGEPVPAMRDARHLMLAFDVSMSMATADVQQGDRRVERLTAARSLADAFLARRDGDRIGLVVFGSQAYLHTPMSFDLQAVRAALAGVQAGLAGKETALGDAIALSVKYLRTAPEHARVLVLLTDGAQTAGTLTPGRAAWLAQRHAVRVHAVGIGASASIDEASLRSIAEQTGGSYTRATDGAALAAFFARVGQAETSGQAMQATPMRELYAWPLALACLLAVALGWHNWREAAA